MKEQILALKAECLSAVEKADTLSTLDQVRVQYLGKKGELTTFLKGMRNLSKKERPVVGALANEIREALETAWKQRRDVLAQKEMEEKFRQESVDVTLPGKKKKLGKTHPLTLVLREIEGIFQGMGYDIVSGPEVELDYYNFEALNMPKDHPARDTQDTFYINENVLLRTHTSPMQVRTMEKRELPIKVIVPGRVYRSDTVDATHSPLFHQIEGLIVDKNITLGDLKGTLQSFAQQLYGEDAEVRFRPHHFQFTEPSAEMDIMCFNCHGEGCPLCKGEGWIEILGCGMVHPKVLSMSGIDPEIYSGFAFGMGLERIVMRRFNINDLRLFFDNDIRFLNQF